MIVGCLLGMDARLRGPKARWPEEEFTAIARRLQAGSGARLTITDDDRQGSGVGACRERPAHGGGEGGAAFVQRREPASVAKILTAAAAYRAGLDADADIRRMTCTGVERYGGKALWCAWPAGRLGGARPRPATSCNVAFASLGVRLGADRLLEEHRLWGFDGGGGSLLGAAGRVHPRPRTPRQVADLAIGLEHADVTPLHAALLAAVVATDGRLPEPRLLLGRCGGLGLVDGPSPPPAGRAAVEGRVARRLRRAMSPWTQPPCTW